MPADHTIKAVAGPDMAVVHGDVEMKGEALSTVSEFELRAGESVSFSLTYQASHLPPPEPPDGTEGC